MGYRYYSTQRPVMPGTIPNKPDPIEIHNFDRREQVDEIGRPAWGWVEYEEPLDQKVLDDYELTEAKKQFYVRLSVTGRFTAQVMASSIEEARIEAVHQFEDADFGPLEEIEGDIAVVEDGDQNPLVFS